MTLPQMCRRIGAVALCGLILISPVSALAFTPYELHEQLAVAPTSTSIRPLYLDQLMRLEAERRAQEEEPAATEHLVAKGETLIAIAKKYDTTVTDLVKLNNLRNANLIREGQTLTVVAPPVQPVVHLLKRGETVWDLARHYNVSMDEIITVNSIVDPHRLAAGQELVIPGASSVVPVKIQKAATESQVLVASRSAPRTVPEPADFTWPNEGRITSGYGPRWGRFHYGIDIANKTGSPIKAAADGTVIEAGWRTGYGYMVRIDHNNGWESLYAHASKLYVSSGNAVTAGQTVAAVGQTGNATGPHVHFELRWQGENVSPVKYLPPR
jgi:murein DD-endopeptidase MepM/ murein hydrolase activator NlpD